jgi:hypothetical protein
MNVPCSIRFHVCLPLSIALDNYVDVFALFEPLFLAITIGFGFVLNAEFPIEGVCFLNLDLGFFRFAAVPNNLLDPYLGASFVSALESSNVRLQT